MPRLLKRRIKHPLREELKQTLRAADFPMSVPELSGIYQKPPKLIAYHLGVLEQEGDVRRNDNPRPTEGTAVYTFEPTVA